MQRDSRTPKRKEAKRKIRKKNNSPQKKRRKRTGFRRRWSYEKEKKQVFIEKRES